MSRSKQIILICAFLVVVVLIPQIYLCAKRGTHWNGAYALLDTDEFGYSAYVNALIHGRPRRNDPYTGTDGAFESLVSIQFVPPYILSTIARLFGFSAATAFILAIPISVIATALSLFWLLSEFNPRHAALATLVIISLGILTSSNPIHLLAVGSSGAFPIFRRYIPALTFPFLMMFCLFLWRSVSKDARWLAGAGLCFLVLVYSYFFIWTSALVWAGVLLILWLAFKPNKGRTLLILFCFGLICVVSLTPYIYMLAHRNPSLGTAVSLQFTRRLDLFRGPEIYGAMILIGLARRKWRESIFALSLALAPFVLFNQQVITGMSLQPFHYEAFVANYWILIALFVLWKEIPKRAVMFLVVGSVMIASLLGCKLAWIGSSISTEFDRIASLRLPPGTVFTTNAIIADSLPSVTSNPVLWGRHAYIFSNLTPADQRNRYFQYLYFCGIDAQRLTEALRTDFTARMELFSQERANPILIFDAKPISEAEIEAAGKEFEAFTENFYPQIPLAYAIVSPSDDLTRLKRWYQLEEIGRPENLIIYKLSAITHSITIAHSWH